VKGGWGGGKGERWGEGLSLPAEKGIKDALGQALKTKILQPRSTIGERPNQTIQPKVRTQEVGEECQFQMNWHLKGLSIIIRMRRGLGVGADPLYSRSAKS